MCRINEQREIIALDRQGTQQQRPESPMDTPRGVRVNTRYRNSTKGTSSKHNLCRYVPCLSSAIISLRLLIQHNVCSNSLFEMHSLKAMYRCYLKQKAASVLLLFVFVCVCVCVFLTLRRYLDNATRQVV